MGFIAWDACSGIHRGNRWPELADVLAGIHRGDATELRGRRHSKQIEAPHTWRPVTGTSNVLISSVVCPTQVAVCSIGLRRAACLIGSEVPVALAQDLGPMLRSTNRGIRAYNNGRAAACKCRRAIRVGICPATS